MYCYYYLMVLNIKVTAVIFSCFLFCCSQPEPAAESLGSKYVIPRDSEAGHCGAVPPFVLGELSLSK